MSTQNFKRIGQFVQKLQGSQNFEIGHVTLSHTPFEPETLNLCRNPLKHTYCQILRFWLDPLLSNG